MIDDIVSKLEAAQDLIRQARALVKLHMPEEAYRREGLGNRLASASCRIGEFVGEVEAIGGEVEAIGAGDREEVRVG